MATVPLPQTGGCLCGAVRFTLTGAPLLAYACHCHGCQTRSGAAFTLNLVVHSADLETSGPAEVRARTTPSGRAIDQIGCAECRTHLISCAPAAPDYATIRAGVLDDAGWVIPIVQTCVDSAIDWAVIPGVRTLPWSEFDFAEQGQAWRATAPEFG